MLKVVAIALLATPLLLMGVVASSGCLVVDVKEGVGERIVVPVPMLVARAAIGFAPEKAINVDVPELAQYSKLLSRLVAELRDTEDGVLVEVIDHGDHVVIEKVGDEIAVEVTGTHEEVSVRLPLRAAAKILKGSEDGRLHAASVLAALSSVSRTDLVHVKDGSDEVKIWIW